MARANSIERRELLQIAAAIGIYALAPLAPMGLARRASASATAIGDKIDQSGLAELAEAAGEALGHPDTAAIEQELFADTAGDAALARLRALVASDFEDGRLVTLANWGLASSEVKLIYLLGQSGP